MIGITSAEVYAWFFVQSGGVARFRRLDDRFGANVPEYRSSVRRSHRRKTLAVLLSRLHGLLILGIILFVAMNAIAFAAAKFIAVVIGLTVKLFGSFGAGGFVRCIASRTTSGQGSPTVRSLYGISLLVALTWLLPLIGWFLALPLTLILGLGSLDHSRSRKSKLEAVGE